MKKIVIAVFGGINADTGACNLDCEGCAPSSIGRREFAIMKEVLAERFGEDTVDFTYFDTMNEEYNGNVLVDQAVKDGHRFPITMVNGSLKWSGAMPLDSIAQYVGAQLVELAQPRKSLMPG